MRVRVSGNYFMSDVTNRVICPEWFEASLIY